MSPFASALGGGREFDRIRRLAARWRDRARGLGDDCALLEAGGERLAVSLDASVDGVHFRRAWLTPHEIGYRAAAAALSDLAAAAAEPMAVLTTLALPPDLDDAALDAIADGLGEATGDAGAVIVGGDLTRAERLMIDVCVIGRAPAPLHRAGARPGDLLVVTGALGGPRAALEAWLAGREPDPAARARFAHPAARHAAARYLAARGARAMIDISDGLAADCAHLAAASGVAVRLDALALPVLPAARAAAEAAGVAPWSFAAGSGEEYELLAAVPPAMAQELLAGTPVPLTVIGACEAGAGVRAHAGGEVVALPPGYDHFRV